MSLYNFYRSKDWEGLLQVLRLERVKEGQLYCEHCGKPILKKYDCIGHHVIELTEENYTDASISLNPDNIKLIHHRCHNIIHDRLGVFRSKQIFIVYGSPLSGKSTWVRENMEVGDLVIDIDNIWQCVSGCERYIKPNRLKSVVFSVRDNLIESARYRSGKWNTCYVIGGYPYAAERERLAQTLGAREIFIDTSKEECIKRLEDDTTGRNKGEWRTYIDTWWLQYQGGY